MPFVYEISIHYRANRRYRTFSLLLDTISPRKTFVFLLGKSNTKLAWKQNVIDASCWRNATFHARKITFKSSERVTVCWRRLLDAYYNTKVCHSINYRSHFYVAIEDHIGNRHTLKRSIFISLNTSKGTQSV